MSHVGLVCAWQPERVATHLSMDHRWQAVQPPPVTEGDLRDHRQTFSIDELLWFGAALANREAVRM